MVIRWEAGREVGEMAKSGEVAKRSQLYRNRWKPKFGGEHATKYRSWNIMLHTWNLVINQCNHKKSLLVFCHGFWLKLYSDLFLILLTLSCVIQNLNNQISWMEICQRNIILATVRQWNSIPDPAENLQKILLKIKSFNKFVSQNTDIWKLMASVREKVVKVWLSTPVQTVWWCIWRNKCCRISLCINFL